MTILQQVSNVLKSSCPLALAALSLPLAVHSLPAQQLTPRQLDAVRRGAAAAEIPPAGTTVPVLGPPDLPLVEVRLNGKGPYRFLVDFGSNVVIVRRAVADDAGLEIVLDREASDIVRAETLTLGAARFDDVWLGAYDELDVDGVLGYNLVMGTGVVLDYVNRTFRLGPLDLGEPDGKHTLSYEVWSRLPFIPARVGDHEFLLNLDTGAANRIVMPAAMADSLRLKSAPQPGPELINNQTGTVRNLVARLDDDIRFGDTRIHEPVVLFDPAVDDAWLGSAILTKSRIEMDTRRQVLRITTKGGLSSSEFRTIGFGLGAFDAERGTRPVTGLIPGTDAAEKLEPGDAVRSIGGVTARDLDAPARRRLAAEGDTIEVEFERGTTTGTARVKVASLPR
jgi:hypothetical protein